MGGTRTPASSSGMGGGGSMQGSSSQEAFAVPGCTGESDLAVVALFNDCIESATFGADSQAMALPCEEIAMCIPACACASPQFLVDLSQDFGGCDLTELVCMGSESSSSSGLGSGSGMSTGSYDACPTFSTVDPLKDPCAPCPPGTYKETADVEPCTYCMLGTFNPDFGATLCSPCPLHSSTEQPGAFDEKECVCDAGYQPDGNGGCVEGANLFCAYAAVAVDAACGVDPINVSCIFSSQEQFEEFLGSVPPLSSSSTHSSLCLLPYRFSDGCFVRTGCSLCILCS
eukprot:3346742-Rhodomonas_salina.1